MYKHDTYTGESATRKAIKAIPFGMGMKGTVAERVVKIEVWCTSIDDAGEDYCELRAFDSDGVQIATRHIHGY